MFVSVNVILRLSFVLICNYQASLELDIYGLADSL